MKYLVVGLGNPGKEYEKTRHNLGFLVMNALIKKLDASKVNTQVQAGFWKAWIHNNQTEILLIEPATYMNKSGQAVSPFLKLNHIPEKHLKEHLIVIHDDLDLPLGKIRISQNASAGGHNGVKSIIEALGTKDFTRVRIGIGRPVVDQPIDEYVLSRFSAEEKKLLPDIIDKAILETEKLFSK